MKRARNELWRSAEVSRLVALLSSERDYLASVLDAVPIPVAVLSENLTVEAGNAAFWSVFGHPINAGIGRPVGEVVGDTRAAIQVWNALEATRDSVRLGGTEFAVTRLADGDEIVLAAHQNTPPAPPIVSMPDVATAPAAEPAFAKVEPMPLRSAEPPKVHNGEKRNAAPERRPAPQVSPSEQFADHMRAVSRLAGGMSHELNNILTIITSYCYLVMDQMSTAGLPTDDLDAIVKATGDAGRLGSQLISIGGRHVTQETAVDVNLVIDAMRNSGQLGAAAEHLVVDSASSLPPVLADARQIEKALTSLVRHSSEVASGEGQLTVRTRHDSVSDSVEVTITDTRLWSDATANLSMFEPYAVYPGTRKTAGLELAVAWSILRQSRAEITVNASEQKGTEISLRFPTVDRVKTADSPGVRETVLLVDDNSEIRSAVKHMLSRQGYDVLEVGNPEEALKVVAQNLSVNILLSDFNMPEMTGRDLATRAKSIRPDLRIIIMSGYADEEVDLSEMGEGELVFLQKPFTPDRLLKTIRSVVGRV